MNYNGLSKPCDACPFLNTPTMRRGFTIARLREFTEGEFPCHKTAVEVETEDGTEFQATSKSVHCAGALIFCEKRNQPSQMMRICERIGRYDRRKLNMKANVR